MNNTIAMRKEALESMVFYDNAVNMKQYQSKYYLPTELSDAPRIAVPITSSVVDRIVALLHQGLEIEIDNPALHKEVQAVLDENDWGALSREIITQTLVGGNYLLLIRALEGLQLEGWKAPYLFKHGGDIYGYEYILKDGVQVPVLKDKLSKSEVEGHTIHTISPYFWDTEDHNFGFTPAVWFNSIDRGTAGYGRPYPNRFKDMVVEFNQIVSQVSKAIKILQNVWNTNLSIENPNQPIKIAPEYINFLGEDGKLEQSTRNLTLDAEWAYLAVLKDNIAQAAQVPSELSGLANIGKLPSGVALQILLQPLEELIGRMRHNFGSKVKELVIKIGKSIYLSKGQTPKDFEVSIRMNEAILPNEKQTELDNILKMVDKEIITKEEAKTMLSPTFKLGELNG